MLVLDGQELDAVAQPGERVAERRDIPFGFTAFFQGPIGVHIVEKKDRKIVPRSFHHDSNID
jgi:hypothetical protein